MVVDKEFQKLNKLFHRLELIEYESDSKCGN
jgi:hypothetical protein